MRLEHDQVVQIETTLDDFNPEGTGLLFERLFAAGALDAFATPVVMKKGRPGILLTALAPPDKAAAVEKVLFDETPTLGVRRSLKERNKLPRSVSILQTSFGPIRIVWGELGDGRRKASPEYEDLREAATRHRVPLPAVQDAVNRALAAHL